MRKIWDAIITIVTIPWVIIEFVFSFVPKFNIRDTFYSTPMYIIIFGIITLVGLHLQLTTPIWLLGIIAGIYLVNILYFSIGVDDVDSDHIGSLSFILLILQFIVLVVGSMIAKDILPYEPTSNKEVFRVENIKYIIDPNNRYVIIDQKTFQLEEINMEDFYKFREQKCKTIIKSIAVKTPKYLDSSFSKKGNSKLECVR